MSSIQEAVVTIVCLWSISVVQSQVREPSLTFDRPAETSPGSTATLKCIMSLDNAMIHSDVCSFTRPNGDTLTVNYITGGDVINEGTQSSESGYIAFKDENRLVCGITVESVDENKDIGQWSCLMNEASPTYWLSLIHI